MGTPFFHPNAKVVLSRELPLVVNLSYQIKFVKSK